MRSTTLVTLLSLCLTIPGLAGCSGDNISKDPELKQSVNYVRYLTSKRFLRNSAFSYTFPEQKPSQFVSYLFSDIGTAEWVVMNDPLEEEQLRSISVPVPSMNVAITNEFMPDQEKQLVLKGNDPTDQIIVEAFVEDSKTPIFTEELPFNP